MNKIPVFISVLLAFLACATLRVAGQRSRDTPQQWSVYNYPDIQTQSNLCRRPNASSICDPDGIISREDADKVDEAINAVYRETNARCSVNSRGFIIKVALMSQMERVLPGGENNTVGLLRDAQMYSYMLTQRWRMEGACNETLLILYSRNNGLLYTLTRRQTKNHLTNNDVKNISMLVRHFFDRTETIADGILEMIQRYKLIFQGKHSEALQTATVRPQG